MDKGNAALESSRHLMPSSESMSRPVVCSTVTDPARSWLASVTIHPDLKRTQST